MIIDKLTLKELKDLMIIDKYVKNLVNELIPEFNQIVILLNKYSEKSLRHYSYMNSKGQRKSIHIKRNTLDDDITKFTAKLIENNKFNLVQKIIDYFVDTEIWYKQYDEDFYYTLLVHFMYDDESSSKQHIFENLFRLNIDQIKKEEDNYFFLFLVTFLKILKWTILKD